MSGGGLTRGIIVIAIAVALTVPTVLAAGSGSEKLDVYVEPATDRAESVKSLFDLTFWIAMVVFVLVEGLLIYILWRFRNNTKVPEGETVRGHTTAEVVWTIIPAGILLFIGFFSAGTLFELDTVPEDIDAAHTINVTATQWGWRFTYPDGNFSSYTTILTNDTVRNAAPGKYNETTGRPVSVGPFAIREGERVKLNIVSRDVIHAFWIPEFAVKIDATPGRTTTIWFETPRLPAGVQSQEFFIQCAEFCGTGHHAMHAALTVYKAGGAFGDDVFPKPAPAS